MKARWFLISVADWVDNVVLNHAFYGLCQAIGASNWWPEGHDRTESGIPVTPYIWDC